MSSASSQPGQSNMSTTSTTTRLREGVQVLPSGTLRLRAPETTDRPPQQRRVQWAESVVNNEGMGRKKSKVCCIYHKPREVGDSSDDSSSDSSSSDEDSENDETARSTDGERNHRDHDHSQCGAAGGSKQNNPSSAKKKSAKRNPNAYERQPKHTG